MNPIEPKSTYSRQIWENGVIYYLDQIQQRLPFNIPKEWVSIRDSDWGCLQDLEPTIAAVAIIFDRTFGLANQRIERLEAICAQASRIVEAHAIAETPQPSSMQTAGSAAEETQTVLVVDDQGTEELVPPKGKMH